MNPLKKYITMETTPKRLLISAGGTGGHIFPALSVANEFRRKHPDSEILFVGALGKMEMEKVPQAGYTIVGLPVMGMPRKVSFKFLKFIFMLLKSLIAARKVIKEFKPHVAAGFGGFASGPILYWASRMKVPTLIQEQNSYAGVTNKILSKRARKICVAYEGMNKFFPESKIVLTGNPVRKSLFDNLVSVMESSKFFNLSNDKPTVLVLGGSLGARSINDAIIKNLGWFAKSDVQLLWQTGKLYYDEMIERSKNIDLNGVKIVQFIDQMEYAYSIADIIISRAGAGTISELCIVGKPVILIPSPNVAEDHQTYNARALSDIHAAILLPDKKIGDIINVISKLLDDKELRKELRINIRGLAIQKADEEIANEIEKLIK